MCHLRRGMVSNMPRALRTASVPKPRTQGERIRYARIACNLSQQSLASAVAAISKQKISKSLVSKWELDGVANPNGANMLAIQAITGFSTQWLVTGKGPQRAEIPTPAALAPLDIDRLAKALAAAEPGLGVDYVETARVVSALYDMLSDTPEIAPALLARFATTLKNA